MNELIDFSKPMNVKNFEKIIQEAFDPSSPNKDSSEQILVDFKEHPSSWTRVDSILKGSSDPRAQFIALQILESAVKTRWSLFNVDQREGLKSYIVKFILDSSNQKESYILKRFNIILVEILKKEWPKNWPTFISDLINASQTISMSVCRNSLEILQRLNEEIFVFSDEITTSKKVMLQNQLKTEFISIFDLIKGILENPNSMEHSLIETTFAALKSFCKKMGEEYLFNTNIIEIICSYLNSPHTVCAIQCLREIVEDSNFSKINENYVKNILHINICIVQFSELYLNKFTNTKLHKEFKNLDCLEKDFIRQLSFFFSAFLETNFKILEEKDLNNFKKALEILIIFSKIEDSKIFKKALIFYKIFVIDLYEEYPYNKESKTLLRRDHFKSALDPLVDIIVAKMPRPEEVFVTVNEYGDLIKEKLTEIEKIEFFKNVKETMFYLACINSNSTKNYFFSKLERFLSHSGYFTPKEINHVCWSIGCISESFSESEEHTFFVGVLKDLLALCEIKSTKTEKAIIASNIIYLIGQYHRFLLSYNTFLKVLIKKLFEFMHESEEGIKDMACDTFLRICEKCSIKFSTMEEEKEVFLIFIFRNIKNITSDLEHYQKRIIYLAFAHVLKNSPLGLRSWLLNALFSSFSPHIITSYEFLEAFTFEEKLVKEVSHIIKSYALVFNNLPDSTTNCLEVILPFFIDFYKKICEFQPTKTKDLLKNDFYELFIAAIKGRGRDQSFLDLVFRNVILDFKQDLKKNYLILQLGSEIVKCCDLDIEKESFLVKSLVNIPSFDADENTNLALKYFELIDTFLNYRFNTFFNCIFSESSFNQFINSLVSGISSLKEVSDLCLNLLYNLIQKLFEQRVFIFFKNYYFLLLENIVGLIFDKDKKYNLDLQLKIFAILINILPQIQLLSEGDNNNSIVADYLLKTLCGCFNNLTKESIELFVVGLFSLCSNVEIFNEHVKDFRINVYEFVTNETYNEEYELLQKRKSLVLKEG